jgi:hypothetical protein
MLSLVDCNQFKANTLSKQIRLMKKANPPPTLKDHEIFEGMTSKKKKKRKMKSRKKKRIKLNVGHENRCPMKQQNKCCN